MIDDFDRCYRAVRSKDSRFDGWFFTAVKTTGIYCRPSCPVPAPRAENVVFYPTAAAAQQAGYRACKRCRPDVTPGSPEWNVRSDLVARSMRLIADGVIDRGGVAALAAELSYSVRQLERLLLAELGAGPLAIARARRAETARLLIETTSLPMTRIAFAAGFASVRQFNDTVRETLAMTPTEVRRRAAGRAGVTAPGALTLRLPYRAPLCPDNLFGHLVATAVPGCEEYRDGSYRRTLRLPRAHAVVALRPTPTHVACELVLGDLRDLTTAIARCRRMLDLDADPIAVDEALCEDPLLAPLVAKAPGRRVPRTPDEDEMAVRAVLGQQVSTEAARTHAARLVRVAGTPIEDGGGGLTHVFPEAGAIAELDPASWGLPTSRREAIRSLAGRLADGRIDVGPGCDWGAARAGLAGIKGIGPWTVETIAMRAFGDPDAFLAGDLGVRRGAASLDLTAAELLSHSRRWSPWRAYAVQHLWATQDHPINRLPEEHP